MKIIAVVNRKGGVGKTTTAFQVATWLSAHKYRVLAIDMDPQANLTKTATENLNLVGIYDVLRKNENINDVIDELKTFHLIHADNELTKIEANLMPEIDREYRLQEAIQSLQSYYDYIIIDTPPTLSLLAINAMVAANYLLVTAQADIYSSTGLLDLYADIQTIRKHCNPNLVISGILLTRYATRTSLAAQVKKILQDIAAQMNTHVYKTVIRETTSIRESQAAGQSIFEFAKSSIGTIDYNAFMKEFMEQIEGDKNGKK